MVAARPLGFGESEPQRWLREMGIDPARVPHADAQTIEELEQLGRELWDLGLRGEDFLAALAGPREQAMVLRTPEELEEFFERELCAPST